MQAVSWACVQLAAGLTPGCLGLKSPRWLYSSFPSSSSRLQPDGRKIWLCTHCDYTISSLDNVFQFSLSSFPFIFEFTRLHSALRVAKGTLALPGRYSQGIFLGFPWPLVVNGQKRLKLSSPARALTITWLSGRGDLQDCGALDGRNSDPGLCVRRWAGQQAVAPSSRMAA